MTALPSSERDEGRPQTFPRVYRLKRRRLIRSLFDRSRKDVGTVAAGCVRLVYRVAPRAEVGTDVPLQIGFTPGRGARRAVDRNRIKRLLREVYRVHQHGLIDLFSCRDDALVVMVLFRGDLDRAAERIPADLPRAFARLHAALSTAEAAP